MVYLILFYYKIYSSKILLTKQHIDINVNNHYGIIKYKWTDWSNVEFTNWCKDYLLDLNSNHTYTNCTYIDTNSSCWVSTNDSLLELCSICGKTMLIQQEDITGYFLWLYQIYYQLLEWYIHFLF